MNHVAIDPKAVIARINADAMLSRQIREVVQDPAKVLPRHRGRVTLMMKSGDILTGVIKIATGQVLAFVKEGDTRTTRIEISDIADFEL